MFQFYPAHNGELLTIHGFTIFDFIDHLQFHPEFNGDCNELQLTEPPFGSTVFNSTPCSTGTRTTSSFREQMRGSTFNSTPFVTGTATTKRPNEQTNTTVGVVHHFQFHPVSILGSVTKNNEPVRHVLRILSIPPRVSTRSAIRLREFKPDAIIVNFQFHPVVNGGPRRPRVSDLRFHKQLSIPPRVQSGDG